MPRKGGVPENLKKTAGPGRPKGSMTLTRALLMKLATKGLTEYQNPHTGEIKKIPKAMMVAAKQVDKAIYESDTNAAKFVFDNLFGQQTQHTDVTTQGQAMQTEIKISFDGNEPIGNP